MEYNINHLKLTTMKTITIKKSENGAFLSCIRGIRGQQSPTNDIMVFNSEFKLVGKTIANPDFSWVGYCESIAMIGGVKEFDNEISVSDMIKFVVENKVEGYTTAGMILESNTNKLIVPLGR